MPDSGFAANFPSALSRILLIDDDAISREVLAMMLEMHGIVIDTAEDGRAAISMLDAALVDNPKSGVAGLSLPLVILMDTQMPGLSGIPLIEALRKRCRGRIIAISGSAVSGEILEATDGFLMKPIEVEALVALLEGSSGNALATRVDLQAASFARPETEQKPVLDPIILGKFKAMMPKAAVREIYAATAEDLRPRLIKLKAAMEAGDVAEVKRIAHAIKGGCAMVGLDRATVAAARLEASNETGDETGNASGNAPSDPSGTYAAEMVQLYVALEALEGMLGEDF